VRGEVKEESPVVEIGETEEQDQGSCKELSGEYMIPGTIYCTMMLGIGVWNGDCKYISGCSDNGNVFFDTMEECYSTCSAAEDNGDDYVKEDKFVRGEVKEESPVVEIGETEEQGQDACKELSGEYMLPGTSFCQRVLGIGVWNGDCKYISGCSDNGNIFFDTIEECYSTCSEGEYNEDEFEMNEGVKYEPTLVISSPLNNGTSHMPYEGIKACVQNTLNEDIYLPGCSVFTLHQGENNATYSQRQCFWEGNAVQLPPGEEYCSNYEMYFRESGEYKISAQYCRVLNERSNEGPPVFEPDCADILTAESDDVLDASCPDAVDCMPIVDTNLELVCAYMKDSFISECQNTMILC